MSSASDRITAVARRLVRALDRALLAVAAVGLVAMMLHISLDILSSLLLNRPVPITSAMVTNVYMIAVAFLPILAAERRGAHIGVSLLTDLMPPRARFGLETFVLALMAAAYAMLLWQSLEQALAKLALGAFVVEQGLKIPVWPTFFMLPAGFGAMALLLALKVALRLATGEDALAPAAADGDAPEVEHV
ncbi:TRAP transporter small permease [Jannaschia sp. W003]|uniref:TRAP transporter small permease n=1 Tax=Jannaschia sp. W003 TaxID=2867012 RepID=UPI0021A5DB24|nr:TRAP transporter small permease [Jannaschia sp. W003]UWQ21791.1 TRAP transporter small permease [Jannaschia sp. W003]